MISKETRDIVRQKFDGCCAFCGQEMKSGMMLWDIEPIATVIDENGQMKRINEELDNLLPACRSCGQMRSKDTKKKRTIEEFRSYLMNELYFLGHYTPFARLLRFEVVKINPEPIVFLFEREIQEL